MKRHQDKGVVRDALMTADIRGWSSLQEQEHFL
jgi:hypothetical protein